MLRNFTLEFSKTIKKGDIIGLIGELGAGKTQFVKMLVQCLGGEIEDVVSPTFTLMNEYKLKDGKFYHFDFYRLNSIEELEEIGYKEFFYSDAIVAVEWIDAIEEVVKEASVIVKFNVIDEKIREVTIVRRQ